MLSHLLRTLNEVNLLLTFDVINVYTNIKYSYGFEAVKFCLEKYPQGIPDRISHNFIIEALKFFLHNNNFLFDKCFTRHVG